MTAAVVLLLVLGALTPATAEAQLMIRDEAGDAEIEFGLLAQPQFEIRERAEGEAASNLFFRRLRLMVAGHLGEQFSFFIETGSPNLGKAGPDGKIVDFFIQDAVFSWAFSDALMLDGGLVLVPLSHNGVQSAAALLPMDYGPFSFLQSGPTDSVVGRDYGAEARGYLFADHLEYRLGVFQGARDLTSPEPPLRFAGRVVAYLLDAEASRFYAGTTLGKRRIVALGAGFDTQDDYAAFAADLFVDHPAPGGGATLQLGWVRYDGGDIFPTLVAQNTWLVEAGWYLQAVDLQPFVQWALRDPQADALPLERHLQLGVGYFPRNSHAFTIKAAVTRRQVEGLEALWAGQLQVQLFAL